MENAVDAGATRIDVAVEQGGARAGARRATTAAASRPSSCRWPWPATPRARSARPTICFASRTLGFRGEALASIAEVSRLVIRSRTADAAAGAELEVSGGQLGPIAPCGCPLGTTIEVHNLFFNTPVRRKFLRATQTEMGHVERGLHAAGAGLSATAFHAAPSRQAAVYDLPPTDDWPARIAAFFGGELAEQLIRVESRDGAVRLSGYVANPSHSRTNPRMQYLFLNGRAIRDRSLQHALGEAYRGLLLTGRYPIAFLEIEMPPEEVDVNVHPTKLEVRFQDGGRLYSQLLGTLRTQFLTTDLTAKLQPAATSAANCRSNAGPRSGTCRQAPGGTRRLGEGTTRPGTRGCSRRPARSASGRLASLRNGRTQAAIPWRPSPHQLRRRGQRIVRWSLSRWTAADSWAVLSDLRRPTVPQRRCGRQTISASDRAALAANSGHPTPSFRQRTAAIQVHDRYLVAETDEGVVVIDQHALHERVLYEEIREKVLAGALETQRLLVPEPVDLAPAESAAALAEKELLARLGVEIEPFGGGTLLVIGYPAMLEQAAPRRAAARAGVATARRRQNARPPRPARRTLAHDGVQGSNQGGRPTLAGRSRGPGRAATPGPRQPPLPPRPPHGPGLHPRRTGQAIQANVNSRRGREVVRSVLALRPQATFNSSRTAANASTAKSRSSRV